MLVEIDLFAYAESAHQFVDSLSFLALALPYSLQVDIWIDLNDVSSAYESTATSSSLEESRHHPRFVRPLSKSSLEQYFKLIRWLYFGATTELILLFLSFEDKFKEETKKLASFFDAGVQEHVKADVIVVT